MRPLSFFSAATALAVEVSGAVFSQSQAVVAPSHFEEGVGHFSEWSRNTKKEFLIDWQNSKESEWIVVLGNEGGDLVSTLTGGRIAFSKPRHLRAGL